MEGQVRILEGQPREHVEATHVPERRRQALELGVIVSGHLGKVRAVEASQERHPEPHSAQHRLEIEAPGEVGLRKGDHAGAHGAVEPDAEPQAEPRGARRALDAHRGVVRDQPHGWVGERPVDDLGLNAKVVVGLSHWPADSTRGLRVTAEDAHGVGAKQTQLAAAAAAAAPTPQRRAPAAAPLRPARRPRAGGRRRGCGWRPSPRRPRRRCARRLRRSSVRPPRRCPGAPAAAPRGPWSHRRFGPATASAGPRAPPGSPPGPLKPQSE
mmetsp:Transcript_69244/g.212295  ORF Transcript_69244/g.212295 Transcript_69244/m.212295 type:complete len:269 (+) Transcript_69244:349-1155(+)